MPGNTLRPDVLKYTAALRWNMPSALGNLAMGLVTAGMVDVPNASRGPWDGAALVPPDFNNAPGAETPALPPDLYLDPALAPLPHGYVQLPAGMLAMQGYAPMAA